MEKSFRKKKLIIISVIIIGILLILLASKNLYNNNEERVESPTVSVHTNEQQITCEKGTFEWSKTVDGYTTHTIADAFISPVYWTYKENLILMNENIVTIDTTYNIREVKYTEYNEEYANSEMGSVNPEFIEIDFDNESKTINLSNLENGTYIIAFTIYNNEDYAEYAFKVDVAKN